MNRLYYVNVAPTLPLPAYGRQAYTYRLPAGILSIPPLYSQVSIFLGSKITTGVIIGFSTIKPPGRIKEINAIKPISLTQQQVDFARWIAAASSGGLGYTLRLFFPPAARQPILKKASAKQRGKNSFLSDSTQKILTALSKLPVVLIEKDIAQRNIVIHDLLTHITAAGGQTLTIVPERSMLAQGPGRLYSADLPSGATSRIWHSAYSGQITAVRGTQKALFLPWRRLKLIIVEEEQYSAHKLWDQYPRLNNVDAAIALARIYQCPLLFTTSYPSLLIRRGLQDGSVISFGHNPITPHGRVIKQSFEDKLKRLVLPSDLINRLPAWIDKNYSILLFSNRRDNRRLYQTITAAFNQRWRNKIIISTSAIFAKTEPKSYDKIIWLWPEQSLTYPDFRSYERSRSTFARLQGLLKEENSSIDLVTKRPPIFLEILTKPADEFAGAELAERKRLFLPPYADQVRLTFTREKKAVNAREQLDRLAEGAAEKIIIRGPFSSLGKNNNKTGWHIILRGQLDQLVSLYRKIKIDLIDVNPANVL